MFYLGTSAELNNQNMSSNGQSLEAFVDKIK